MLLTAGGALIYFGDIRGTVYAVDARSGVLAWRERVDTHNLARITGTPVLAGGRLYVPVSGVGEEAQAKNPNYECCTFRGSVVALDADALLRAMAAPLRNPAHVVGASSHVEPGMRGEHDRWSKIIREANIKIEG